MPKLIQVSEDTYARLVELGKYGDTMDAIILRLLPEKEVKRKQ